MEKNEWMLLQFYLLLMFLLLSLSPALLIVVTSSGNKEERVYRLCCVHIPRGMKSNLHRQNYCFLSSLSLSLLFASPLGTHLYRVNPTRRLSDTR